MDNAYAPFFEVSSTNHAGWVVIVTVTFLVYSIMGVVAKLVSRFLLAAVMSYDWSVMLGIVFAFVQSVWILMACRNCLGKHETILSSLAIELFSKTWPILFYGTATSLTSHRTYMPL